jgi:hypothetical protein
MVVPFWRVPGGAISPTSAGGPGHDQWPSPSAGQCRGPAQAGTLSPKPGSPGSRSSLTHLQVRSLRSSAPPRSRLAGAPTAWLGGCASPGCLRVGGRTAVRTFAAPGGGETGIVSERIGLTRSGPFRGVGYYGPLTPSGVSWSGLSSRHSP